MATPPDVVAGEVIEVEWGNAVRDWACFGVTFGGTVEVVTDSSLSSTYENGATVSFVPDADWIQYKVMAWGSVQFSLAGVAPAPQMRISIAGNVGTANPAVSQEHPPLVNHSVSSLSGTQSVIIQYRDAGTNSTQKAASWINFIAIRTS